MEPLTLRTERLTLTQPGPGAADRVAAFFRDNRAHLAPWAPPRPPAFETVEHWAPLLEADRHAAAHGKALRLFLFARDAEQGEVLGHMNFSTVVRGAWHACNLGYDLGAPHQGQGLMTEALSAGIEYAFESWNLHRIQANYVPTNERSGRVLRRLGFVVEGYARDYLLIAGAWRDHVLTSLTNQAWSAARAGIPL